MRNVFSSNINKIGYEPDTKTLMVEFSSGKTARYANVPPDVAKRVGGAASIGTAFNEHIRGKYEHAYLGGK